MVAVAALMAIAVFTMAVEIRRSAKKKEPLPKDLPPLV